MHHHAWYPQRQNNVRQGKLVARMYRLHLPSQRTWRLLLNHFQLPSQPTFPSTIRGMMCSVTIRTYGCVHIVQLEGSVLVDSCQLQISVVRFKGLTSAHHNLVWFHLRVMPVLLKYCQQHCMCA